METWRSVSGYEGLYEVSSIGRVRSLDHWVKNRYAERLRRGRIMKLTPDRGGYMMVGLSKDCRVRTSKVHRLVATAFLGPAPSADAMVNHRDFNKDHNAVENLEWCTYDQNLQHAVAGGRFEGTVRPRRGKKLDAEKARAIKAARASGETSKSIAARFAISPHTVNKVCNCFIWSRA